MHSNNNLFFQLILLFSIFGVLCFPIVAAESCSGCGTTSRPDSVLQKITDNIKKKAIDRSTDNIEDCTAEKRLAFINPILYEHMSSHEKEFMQKELYETYADLANNDPIPSIRSEAYHQISGFWIIPWNKREKVLEKGLTDSSMYVRVAVATMFLRAEKRIHTSANKQALSIVTDAAIGKNYESWNVKGFYTETEFEQNHGIIDSFRDRVQFIARLGLDAYGINSIYFLDSVANHNPSEKIRKSARHGSELN